MQVQDDLVFECFTVIATKARKTNAKADSGVKESIEEWYTKIDRLHQGLPEEVEQIVDEANQAEADDATHVQETANVEGNSITPQAAGEDIAVFTFIEPICLRINHSLSISTFFWAHLYHFAPAISTPLHTFFKKIHQLGSKLQRRKKNWIVNKMS